MEDLTEIIQELTAVAAYWFTVGVFLKVPYHTLESIKKNHQEEHHDESKECLREMLAAWLSEREASPAVLVQAVKAAGNIMLAKKVAVKHGKSTWKFFS